MLAQMSIGMYYCVPMVALFYFMSTQHQIHVTYYMFVYYFTGNVIFGLVLYMFIVIPVDRPILAMLNLKRDVKDAERNQDYKLEQYLENFRASDLFDNVQFDGASGDVNQNGGGRGQAQVEDAAAGEMQAALLGGELQAQTGELRKPKPIRDTSGLGRDTRHQDRATAATDALRDPTAYGASLATLRAGTLRAETLHITEAQPASAPGLADAGDGDGDQSSQDE